MTPELSEGIRLLVNELLLHYGIKVLGLIFVILFFVWKWFENKISGEVEKGVNKHKADIENTHARQIENYQHYVAKQHEVYSQLNKLLLEAEGIITYQVLKSYPDFKYYSEQELTEYLQERYVAEYELKRLLKLMSDPKELQKEMEDYVNRYRLEKARDLWTEARNHYWVKALYFSDKVSKFFLIISKKLNESLLIQEYPSGKNGYFTKNERQELLDLQKELRPSIEKLIKLMKKELSAGYAN